MSGSDRGPIERAARALYERWLSQPDVVAEAARNGPHPSWEGLGVESRAKWADDFRAGITAIQEPSAGMVEAGDRAILSLGLTRGPGIYGTENCWQAMIDKMLEEG